MPPWLLTHMSETLCGRPHLGVVMDELPGGGPSLSSC